MQPGNIVEYIDKQKIQCAVILEANDQKLRLLSETAREVVLSPGRLTHASAIRIDLSLGRDKAVQALKTVAEKRAALSETVDIRPAWEVLNTEQTWIPLFTMTGLLFPETPDADHESAVIRAFFKNRLYFKFGTDSFFPYTEEQVHLATLAAEKEERKKQLVSEGIQWIKALLTKSSPGRSDLRDELAEILKAYYLFGKDSESGVLAKAILTGAGVSPAEDLFPLLVKAGIFQENENLDLYIHRVRVAFPDELLHQVPVPETMPPAESRRRSLAGLSVLTIDGASTLDFDDALSIEDRGDHHVLGIHIADVGAFIRKGDRVDLEALARGSSIYTPDQTIPMLPAELSENRCSLVAGVSKLALSVMITLSPSGEILSYEIFPSELVITRQLSYPDADALMPSDAELGLLYAIARRFRAKRLDAGAMHISIPEVTAQIDTKGVPTLTRSDRESPSRMLVAELMILANATMARFLAENAMPAVFRSQAPPKERLYSGDGGTLFQHWMQRKVLSRFALGTSPEKHAGLGVDAYVTGTSPIRKYYDLITQRQIRAVLGLEAPYSAEDIRDLLAKLTCPMGVVSKIQYNRNRYWLLKYLETRIGKKEEAVVLGKRKDGYQILLPAYMFECFLPQPGNIRLKPEDYLHITFQHVNARKDALCVFMG